jgi:iron(III) transport system permease protein
VFRLSRPSRWVLLATSLAFSLLLPLAGVVGLSLDAPPALWTHLRTTVLGDYLRTTLVLSLGVGALTAVLGAGLGWLVVMTAFPGRRVLKSLQILPLAVPSYLLAYAYGALFAESAVPLRSLPGAVLLFASGFYPYVYILARAAFMRQSAGVLDSARTLGQGPWRSFWRVSLPIARPAIVAGVALAVMETLGEFGAVTYLGVPTFASGIYRAWFGLGSAPAAARLSLYLLLILAALLWVERTARQRQVFYGAPSRTDPPVPRRLTGWQALLAMGACILPVLAGFVLPVGILITRALPQLPVIDWGEIWQLTRATVLVAGGGALLTVALAVPLAFAVRLRPGRVLRLLTALSCLGYGIPGGVIAIGVLAGLQYFGSGVLVGLLASGVALAYGYGVRFMALAYGNLESAYGRIPLGLDQAARTLGAGPFRLAWRVHLPLLRPGLVAATLLTFVESVKELPMTLALHPFNFETLAVRTYHLASDERLGEAAVPALIILLLTLVPAAVILWREEQP